MTDLIGPKTKLSVYRALKGCLYSLPSQKTL